jgi:hypothetical protein
VGDLVFVQKTEVYFSAFLTLSVARCIGALEFRHIVGMKEIAEFFGFGMSAAGAGEVVWS